MKYATIARSSLRTCQIELGDNQRVDSHTRKNHPTPLPLDGGSVLSLSPPELSSPEPPSPEPGSAFTLHPAFDVHCSLSSDPSYEVNVGSVFCDSRSQKISRFNVWGLFASAFGYEGPCMTMFSPFDAGKKLDVMLRRFRIYVQSRTENVGSMVEDCVMGITDTNKQCK